MASGEEEEGFNSPLPFIFFKQSLEKEAYYYHFVLKDYIKILGFFSVATSLLCSSEHSVNGINLGMSEETLVTLALSSNYQYLWL